MCHVYDCYSYFSYIHIIDRSIFITITLNAMKCYICLAKKEGRLVDLRTYHERFLRWERCIILLVIHAGFSRPIVARRYLVLMI